MSCERVGMQGMEEAIWRSNMKKKGEQKKRMREQIKESRGNQKQILCKKKRKEAKKAKIQQRPVAASAPVGAAQGQYYFVRSRWENSPTCDLNPTWILQVPDGGFDTGLAPSSILNPHEPCVQSTPLHRVLYFYSVVFLVFLHAVSAGYSST